jgi:hypothetical protein
VSLPPKYGRVWRQRIVPAVLRRDARICHICGHSGADTADHLFPVAEMNDEQFKKLMMDPANLKAAHHKACEICSALAADRGFGPIRCNPLRGALSLDRVRRIINKRTGQHLDEGTVSQPSEPEGREF